MKFTNSFLLFILIISPALAFAADDASKLKILVRGTFIKVDSSPTFRDGPAEYVFKSDNLSQNTLRLYERNPRDRCRVSLFTGDKMIEGDLVEVYEFPQDPKSSCQPRYQVKILKHKK